MTHLEIVKKLVGNIQPVGETNADKEGLENLKIMCNLVNDLVCEIDKVYYENKDRKEFSIKTMADYADHFMNTTLGLKE